MKKIVTFMVVAVLLTACSSIQVYSDFDKTTDFSQYKSVKYYGWADNSDKILNRFDKERIEGAFATEFSKRGISIQDDDADMIVSLYVVTEQKTEKSATTTHMGGYGGYYGYGPGYGWDLGHSHTSFNEYDYTVGTLIVSVFDAKEEKLIWESVGKGTVDEDPKNAEEKVDKAIAQIMKDFPIQVMQ